MPIYSYKCDKCNKIIKKLQKTPSETLPCPCGAGRASFQIPSTASSTTLETKDKYRGKSLPKNQDKLLKKRMKEHHNAYEIEEKIDRHGLKEAQKEGWDKEIKRK
jgi:putative FmdB family regulatory protein